MTNNRSRWLAGTVLLAAISAFGFVSNSPTAVEAKGAKRFTVVEAAQKDGQTISCPLSTVRAEIITALPSPWWQTPQEGRFVGTRLATIGGKRTLVCEYSAYGTRVAVMREYPTGVTECRALPKGFFCR